MYGIIMITTKKKKRNDKYILRINSIGVTFMSEEDVKKELVELRERVVKLEVKVEELNKRIERLSNYAKELYNYLQKQSSKPIF